ncbi:hypothetical protein SKAU_G00129500 [Synaphobranchus kaupii]|uniref:Integrase catalytic domain-containing protein n=1 Tax=Synaphobranchus kaupii TaxID=118154 RepID=A0A9Q1FDM3_SYNKA|nr:hypothetical protein SKAU_G00342570 [Synaphobranchus kaupii]KAJ8349847.1 hypothetical protein SKAU_G00249770 [Synaphobranchus kaupii]KAJ8356356.1 hypothetical protein SKAU_G00191500 [Synaphobranchus kaupii]KAJ8358788.1 hypothetical protein SKAU_G00153130 [Synaphobranchus kaupii]KAJ8362847.1 hypothetical protein SKAU_G00116780 [Synaphobranchus kaupii]
MHLLKETDLTLDKAIKICQASECAKAQIKTFSQDSESAEVNAVKHVGKRAPSKRKEQKPTQSTAHDSKGCERCGNRHMPKQCPAFGKDCRKCGGRNHFAKCCFSKKKVQLVEQLSDSEEDDGPPLFCDAATVEGDLSRDEWIAHLKVNGTEVPLKLDTGAQVNILPMKDLKRLKNRPKRHQYQQPKEPMRPHDRPQEPWCKVGMDLFQLKGKDYLLVMDYYSKYPEYALLSDTTAEQVVARTKAIFSRQGIPLTVISDNGPQFSSQCFRDFSKTYGFEHITSSPRYPQSNGLAEKGVQIVKRSLKKAMESNEDPYLAILNYRASPLENGLSPGEMLMKRKLRTRLPSARFRKEQREPAAQETKQMEYYNRTTKPLRPLAQEEIVRVRCDGQWGPLAKVVKETTPRSYEVITEHGNTLRRNRRHLLKVPKKEIRVSDNTEEMTGIRHDEQPDMTIIHATPENNNSTGDRTQREGLRREIVKPKRLIEEM